VRVVQKGAHLSEVCYTGDPEAVLGQIGKIVCGELFERSPRLLLAAELAVDQGQARTPGRDDPVLLHKVPDDWSQFMQAPLLPAQGEHLHAKGPVYTLCLQPLPNGQSLLGEFLTLRKATV
jgi:hypothetical protein